MLGCGKGTQDGLRSPRIMAAQPHHGLNECIICQAACSDMGCMQTMSARYIASACSYQHARLTDYDGCKAFDNIRACPRLLSEVCLLCHLAASACNRTRCTRNACHKSSSCASVLQAPSMVMRGTLRTYTTTGQCASSLVCCRIHHARPPENFVANCYTARQAQLAHICKGALHAQV